MKFLKKFEIFFIMFRELLVDKVHAKDFLLPSDFGLINGANIVSTKRKKKL